MIILNLDYGDIKGEHIKFKEYIDSSSKGEEETLILVLWNAENADEICNELVGLGFSNVWNYVDFYQDLSKEHPIFTKKKIGQLLKTHDTLIMYSDKYERQSQDFILNIISEYNIKRHVNHENVSTILRGDSFI